MMSVCLSICLSVRLSLNISETTELIGLYSSGNITTGPVVVLGYFLEGWDTHNPPKNKKIPPHFFPLKILKSKWGHLPFLISNFF